MITARQDGDSMTTIIEQWPGPDLDRRISEDFLHWQPLLIDSAELWYIRPGQEQPIRPPAWSTDWRDMGWLMNQLAYVRLERRLDDTVWYAIARITLDTLPGTAFAPEAPLAVCRAILAAMEGMV